MKLFSLPAPSRTDMVIVRLRARPLLHQSQLLCIPKSYHIVGNFQGPYISRIVIKFIFAEINFVDCMIKATPTHSYKATKDDSTCLGLDRGPPELESSEAFFKAQWQHSGSKLRSN